jgi:hypothetical protein
MGKKVTHILKHKNINSAYLWIENGQVLDVNEIKNPEHLPYKHTEDIGKNVKLLNNWIAKRGIPFSREDYDLIADKYKVKDLRELTILSSGLNLTDHFWLCDVNKEKKWEEVNFLENKFSVRIGEILPELTEKYEEFINPDFSSNGRLKKFWAIDGEKRILCKDGSGDIRQEPFNEKIASAIASELGISNVEYNLGKSNNGTYYSKCECMINKDLEFVNAFIVYLDGKNSGNRYEDYIDICNKKGISNAKEEVNKMVILDYIIRNTDRHVGNFGILRNSENLKWERIAPVFDNGNSFWYNAQGLKFIDGKTNSQSRSFKKYNEENILLVDNIKWFDKNKLANIPELMFDVLKRNNNLDSERIIKIVDGYKYRIDNVESLFKESKRKINVGRKDKEREGGNNTNLVNRESLQKREYLPYSEEQVDTDFKKLISGNKRPEITISGEAQKFGNSLAGQVKHY